MHAGGHRTRGFLVAAGLMTAAGLLAAEALWSVRPHGFLTFMAWAACATVVVVLERLGAPARRTRRVSSPTWSTWVAIGVVALYLRRAL